MKALIVLADALLRCVLFRKALVLCLFVTAVFTTKAAVISENFSSNPESRNWRKFGNTNLFRWNSTNQNLEVTWDSSQSNSYFHQPLGTILAKSDDFTFTFDLKLSDIAVGVNTNKPYTFPLCIGFQNISNATGANFFRGNGHASPNLAEFAFYPDSGFGPTLWPSFWSTNSVLNFSGPSDYTIIDLPIGVTMHIAMTYTASNKTCATTITTNGVSIGTINNTRLLSFTDFRVDTFAIESYSDAGQNPDDGGSLLAHGTIDNLVITIPPPPVQDLRGAVTNNQWQVQFTSRTNWNYILERTVDFQNWTNASLLTASTGTNLFLQDTNALATKAFYRVRANRP
jgi:hypothetical protein